MHSAYFPRVPAGRGSRAFTFSPNADLLVIVAGRLREGIYEHLMTRAVASELAHEGELRADVAQVDKADLARVLARHVARELELRLRDTSDPDEQLALTNTLLATLDANAAAAEGAEDGGDTAGEEQVARAERLHALYRATPPLRPLTPLTASALLTRSSKDPVLGHELKAEIASADTVDVVAAFITRGGTRQVWPELEALANRGGRLRVLTTVFTGSTELGAVEALARLPGAEVRVSYDVERTRLHAKAWLFGRERGGEDLHTAYVGSANLTHTALSSGQEWTIKTSAADLPDVVRKFRATFEALWNDPEFELFDGSEAARDKLRAALADERGTAGERPGVLPSAFRPKGYQQDILDRLVAERELHGHRRNLVVAATGTGKTVVAAFDYAGICAREGTRPRMLFMAHRREILEQALATFRRVLRDGAFGELWVDGEEPSRFEHVFASVQTASRALEGTVTADHFRYVVVDECHHLPAESYQRTMRFLAPHVLLGITATPERSDGRSLLPDFGGRIAAELRLWHALEKELLVPFEYYGLSDGIDLSQVKWSRAGYGASDLDRVYVGNEARVDVVMGQLERRVGKLEAMRALAFCVSVEHAEYMAKSFSERGIRAIAVHGQTDAETREAARGRLERREVQIVCTCDLYNEGVDLPFVDTLLLLRPTASATLFMQQLGRGLRLHEGKTSCLVLDFIGQHRKEFRFDDIYSALTGVPRAQLEAAARQGFPFLPSGCVLELDAVAQKTVLASLKRQVPTVDHMVRELQALAASHTANGKGLPTLGEFLEASGREVDDVYNAGGYTTLQGRAGLTSAPDDDTADLSRRLGWLSHVDEPARLEVLRAAVSEDPFPASYEKRLAMLDFQLNHRGELRDVATVRTYLRQPGIAQEVRGLADVLDDRIAYAPDVYPVPEWPLALRRHYSRREIMAAIGFVNVGEKGRIPQGGILMLKEQKRELLFVTLDKTAKSFSPSTQYRDYWISDTLFHWETQGAASASKPSGKRYTESPGNGWRFFLFVRKDTDAMYEFFGEVRMKSWEGDRPIGVVWERKSTLGR